jgi:hypothetical protein
VFGREGSLREYWGEASCVEECDEEGVTPGVVTEAKGREDDACATPMRILTRKQLQALRG